MSDNTRSQINNLLIEHNAQLAILKSALVEHDAKITKLESYLAKWAEYAKDNIGVRVNEYLQMDCCKNMSIDSIITMERLDDMR